ncbi:Adenylate kinase [Pontiella desulfatans]|uniref:Adenylate kinase n=1 Tax=Pontiella desulfatans TaxID=2750659 RepID=A0A6C2U7C6_PONDE|nr:adenylate kinase [Pontiella desulfatans]VGO15783.1 Adenylate kinase [Pontiella desulfatans]
MNAVVLLGPPGAGKGTVAEVLVDKGYRHVSTGDLLREQIRLETPLGLEAKQLMDQGKFVPDDVVVGMIRDLLSSRAAESNYLFDGFPRTLVQAEKLDELLGSLNGTLEEVVLLECPDDVIVERLSGRRTCSKCGSVYHVKFNPASNEDLCDIEGCELTQRPDDNAETIRKRLVVYAEQTAPLITYYEAKGLVHPIDATQRIDQVRAAVLEKLG